MMFCDVIQEMRHEETAENSVSQFLDFEMYIPLERSCL